MLRTGLRIPSPLTPCYFQVDARFISRLANTDNIDRPIYGLSAHSFNIDDPNTLLVICNLNGPNLFGS